MGQKSEKVFKAVTIVAVVAVLVTAGYIMLNQMGLVEGYDFGVGAYYYVDIPEFEKILPAEGLSSSVPFWVYVVLFFAWGWLMWRLWLWIDRK